MEKEFDPRIERYFSDEMNEQERSAFEKELSANDALKNDCKLYAIMIKGIQSEGLRQKPSSGSVSFADREEFKASLLAKGLYEEKEEEAVEEEFAEEIIHYNIVPEHVHIIIEHPIHKTEERSGRDGFPLQKWLAAASVVLAVGLAALWFVGQPDSSGSFTAQITSKSPKNVQGFAGTGAAHTYTVEVSNQKGPTLYSFSEGRLEISGPDATTTFQPLQMEIFEWISYGAKFVYLKNNEMYYQLQEGARQQPLEPSPRPDVLE